MDKRIIGSFYTPKIIADFLVDYLSEKMAGRNMISILEPSAGDGSFIKTLCNNKLFEEKTNKVVAVEREEGELNKIKRENSFPFLQCIHSDFLEYQKENSEQFSLVLGNPPYIKKNFLEVNQIALCEHIHKGAFLSTNSIKNIWTAFLVRCIKFTADDGIMAFVLPAELLQVKYASEIRQLIINEFERVEVFTFGELLFDDCKGQDTLLLIAERKSRNKGVYYCNIKKAEDLESRNFQLVQNVNIKESKWTHHHLQSEEIELMERIRLKIKTVNDYSSSKAGIVTAANNYFIVDKKTLEQYSFQELGKPIIQKGLFVNGSVELDFSDFSAIVDQNKPAYLLAFDQESVAKLGVKFEVYKSLGEKDKLHERFKMLQRANWYEVPNIVKPAEGFFFKRCDKYPKLIKNSAQVLVTDSAYVVSMRDQHEIEDLIFSFYNSLTLSFAELNGRHYGGGVLELTPNEFKGLPIPFIKIGKKRFKSYVQDFEHKESIKDVCFANDSEILKSIDTSMDDDVINKLFTIREKLYLSRIKK